MTTTPDLPDIDLPNGIHTQPLRPSPNYPPTWAVTMNPGHRIGDIELHDTNQTTPYHIRAYHPSAGQRTLEPATEADLHDRIEQLITLWYDPDGNRATRGW